MQDEARTKDDRTTTTAPEPIPGCEGLAPEVIARLRKAAEEGHITLPTRSKPAPVTPLSIPGFSLTEELLAMREEE